MTAPPLASTGNIVTAAVVIGPLLLLALAYGRRVKHLALIGHSVVWRRSPLQWAWPRTAYQQGSCCQ